MVKVFSLAAVAVILSITVSCSMEPDGEPVQEEQVLTLGDYEAEARSLPAAYGLSGRLTPIELLGKYLFFDENLSRPRGQSCAACHAPETGFTGPNAAVNRTTVVYPGAVPSRFGNRKPPTSAYGGDSPVLALIDEDEDCWAGGMFWDGRASGLTLGDPLAEQAQGPFLNPLEQNLPTVQALIREVRKSRYAGLFGLVWGKNALYSADQNLIFEQIARSIAAYERSAEVNPFSSKYDAWLKGKPVLTARELRGLALFNDPQKGNCAACHPSDGNRPLFTDFTYDNLGIPRNPDNPFYGMPPEFNPQGAAWVDPGLGGFLNDTRLLGKHKVPTLRNVDKRPYAGFPKAFGHNGYFKSLETIVHFYNTRDLPQMGWPAPEVAQNVNSEEMGNLGLTAGEEAAIVAFLKTLSDGYSR